MKKEAKDKHFIKKPYYKEGPEAAKRFISENLTYPEEARKAGVSGTVTVRYTIDHKGNVIATKVLSGIGHGCDEEAMRVISLMKFEVPKTRGVRVQFHQTRHIHFKQSKTKPQQSISYNYQVTKPVDQPRQQRVYGYKILIQDKEK